MAGLSFDLLTPASENVASGFDLLTPLGGSKPAPKVAQDIADAFLTGMQSSTMGLITRGKAPDRTLAEGAPWYHRISAGAAGMIGDIPAMVAGGVATAPLGPIGMAAGTFAAPMALRDALMTAYGHNAALSWAGAVDIAMSGLKGGAKGAVIGAVTGGAGALAKGAMIAEGATVRAATAVATGTELAALTASSAAVEGHMPTWQDFMDNAILLGGAKGAMHVAKGLRAIYAETGKLPSEVAADAAVNPEIKAALEAGTPPKAYEPVALEERVKAFFDTDPAKRLERIKDYMMGSKDPVDLGKPFKADNPAAYEYITNSDTLRGVLAKLETEFKTEIETQTRGKITDEAGAAQARKLIAEGEIGAHEPGVAENKAQVLARGMVLDGVSKRTFDTLRALEGKDPAALSPLDKVQAIAAIEQLATVVAEFRGVRAEAGRALQAFAAMKRDASLIADAEALVKLYERKGDLSDIVKGINQLKDPAQMRAFAEGYVKATTPEKVLEAWKVAILSGPITHLANMVGNVTKWVVDIPESVVSASAYAIDRAVSGEPLKMAQWKARAFAPLIGWQRGGIDAVKAAAEGLKVEASGEKVESFRPAIEGTTGKVVRIPFRLLSAADQFFRTPAERAQAYIQAVDRAVKEGLHPDSIEGKQRIEQYVQRPDFGLEGDAAAAALKSITEAGDAAVFTSKLGKRMSIFQSQVLRGSPLEYVIPFFRTPANLLSWAVQHTPAAPLMSARWRADFAAGGERAAQATTRVVLGTGLMMTAYSFAANGTLTGGGMFDKEEGGTKRAAGWQPYSIKIGDKYYSYQRVEPVSKLLGLAADMIEMSQVAKDREDRAKIGAMLVLMFGNATISTTYLSGLSNAMQSLTDPARYGGNFIEQYAAGLVPKIIGQVAAVKDPYKREVDGVVDAIQSQIPFLREKLLPKRDVWGEPTKNDRWFEVMPVTVTAASQDKVRTEAMRLHVAIADAPRTLTEKGPFNPRDKAVELKPEQRDIMREVSGKKAMEYLSPIVNSPDWAQIPDFAKAEIYRDILKGTRKEGAYAALPPDAEERLKVQRKITDRIVTQIQQAEPDKVLQFDKGKLSRPSEQGEKVMRFNSDGRRQ